MLIFFWLDSISRQLQCAQVRVARYFFDSHTVKPYNDDNSKNNITSIYTGRDCVYAYGNRSVKLF